MKKLPGGKLALALLALLGVSFVLLVFAKDEKLTNPTIESTYPSGLSAFAELLRRDGYQVSLDKKVRPQFHNGDLVLCVQVDKYRPPFASDHHIEKVEEAIDKFVNGGGAELRLKIPNDYEEASRDTTISEESPLPGLPAKKVAIRRLQDTPVPDGGERRLATTATAQWHDGRIVTVEHGLGATNRYLAQGDNAEVYLQYVHMLAPKGSRIVFPEALIDNIEHEGPLDSLGPWAVAGRTQAYLLALVVVGTLAIRFGSPLKEEVRQRSSRDMVDAVSEIFRRGGKAQYALSMALDDTYDRFRLGIGAPVGVSQAHLKERMPEALLQAVSMAEKTLQTGSDDGWGGQSRSLRAVQELDRQARAFEHDTRQRRQPA
ncbi:MAG: hypothetical protein JSS65_12610 [Armatimonadetes bacterium]|nr:hypothetical protein [Armatimonadota bacterium]